MPESPPLTTAPPIGSRRQSRVFAIQVLYLLEIKQSQQTSIPDTYWRRVHASKQARSFAQKLVETVLSQQKEIDDTISSSLIDWKFNRLSVILRQVLRLAICEMVILKDQPPKIIINEALELTRTYMDEESVGFVNNVLDKCLKAHLETTQSAKPAK